MAPTPSGWLHIGNLCSFLLTRLWADEAGAEVLLRIDDLDVERTRDVYLDDIFNELDWAKIRWEIGPRDTVTHKAHFSQQWSFEFYQAVLDECRVRHPQLFFVCDCSRKDRSDGKACECRSSSKVLRSGESALMLDLQASQGLPIGFTDFSGQPVRTLFQYPKSEVPIVRREGIFSYHWVSLNEDRRGGITHVVRGEDLLESTIVQIAMEQLLFEEDLKFSRSLFLHHSLLTDPDGRKLSKSEASQSVLELRSSGFSYDHFLRVFADFIGMPVEENLSLESIRGFLRSQWNLDEQ